MAVQFHVAHSSIVKGAGVLAGVPYNCAEQSASRATTNCMKPDAANPPPDPEHLKNITDALARHEGAMDDVRKLENARVWLFSGRRDKIVHTPVMEALRDYYAYYIPADRIVWRNDIDAGHAMMTMDYGGGLRRQQRAVAGRLRFRRRESASRTDLRPHGRAGRAGGGQICRIRPE